MELPPVFITTAHILPFRSKFVLFYHSIGLYFYPKLPACWLVNFYDLYSVLSMQSEKKHDAQQPWWCVGFFTTHPLFQKVTILCLFDLFLKQCHSLKFLLLHFKVRIPVGGTIMTSGQEPWFRTNAGSSRYKHLASTSRIPTSTSGLK